MPNTEQPSPSSSSAEDRLKQQQAEAARRENVLVMRLTTKEQEVQDYLNQLEELRSSSVEGGSNRSMQLLDPAVNILFEKMSGELKQTRDRLEQSQQELNAWKFTPDSATGKKLMAKCRTLYQENEELGKMVSSGRIAKLEADIAMSKNLLAEMRQSQEEVDDLVLEMDDNMEGLQMTVGLLQQRATKAQQERTQATQQDEPGPSNTNSDVKMEDETEVVAPTEEVLDQSVEEPCPSLEAQPAAPIVKTEPKPPDPSCSNVIQFAAPMSVPDSAEPVVNIKHEAKAQQQHPLPADDLQAPEEDWQPDPTDTLGEQPLELDPHDNPAAGFAPSEPQHGPPKHGDYIMMMDYNSRRNASTSGSIGGGTLNLCEELPLPPVSVSPSLPVTSHSPVGDLLPPDDSNSNGEATLDMKREASTSGVISDPIQHPSNSACVVTSSIYSATLPSVVTTPRSAQGPPVIEDPTVSEPGPAVLQQPQVEAPSLPTTSRSRRSTRHCRTPTPPAPDHPAGASSSRSTRATRSSRVRQRDDGHPHPPTQPSKRMRRSDAANVAPTLPDEPNDVQVNVAVEQLQMPELLGEEDEDDQ